MLNWGDAGWVHFFSKNRLNSLDDLRKMKLFTWAGDADELELWKASGFRPVPLPADLILISLETGLIDAVPTVPLLALSTQFLQRVSVVARDADSLIDQVVQVGMRGNCTLLRSPYSQQLAPFAGEEAPRAHILLRLTYGVVVNPELPGQSSHTRQRLAGLQLAGRDQEFDLRRESARAARPCSLC